MSRRKAVSLLGGAVACVGIASVSTGAMANPVGATYEVIVTTSFHTKFKDCYSFSATGGVLTVAGLGSLTYHAGTYGPGGSFFDAVSPLSLASSIGCAIAFDGEGVGTPTQGYARFTGLDEQGDHYHISGPTVASCSLSAKELPTAANYLPPK